MKKQLAFFTLASSLRAATTTTNAGVGASGSIAIFAGLLVGGFMIYMSIVNGRKAKASLTWTSVAGEVVFSGMITDGSDQNTFYPSVTYNYSVNGQPLQSSRVGFNGVKSKKMLAKYPKGSRVEVFFDPNQPSTAVLEKGGSTKTGMFVGAAVILGSLVMGIVLK
jgi:hypothetical protein